MVHMSTKPTPVTTKTVRKTESKTAPKPKLKGQAKAAAKQTLKPASKNAIGVMAKGLASQRSPEVVPREQKREEEKAQRLRNGDELRELLARSGLTIEDAVDAFNKGQARPVSVSAFKSWLSASESSRRRGMPDAAFAHAKAVLGHHAAAQRKSA